MFDYTKILEERENRAHYQAELQAKYDRTLVVIKANYPGYNKNNPYTTYITTKYFFLIDELFIIDEYFVDSTLEGVIYYLLINEDALKVKASCIELELNTVLGRYIDIDILVKQKSISRTEFGYPPRTCMVCDEVAFVCSRSKKHNPTHVQNIFTRKVLDSITTIEDLTIFGLINEINKPIPLGCVSITSSGNHNDMDIYTFINSIRLLKEELSLVRYTHNMTFKQLRRQGISIEKKLLKVTDGVNTYKGLIFMLLLIYAAMKKSSQYQDISTNVTHLSKHIFKDFKNKRISSNGVNIHNDLSIKGVRGLAFEGLKIITNDFVDYYDKDNDINRLFFYIISNIDDTTIIHRSNYIIMKQIQVYALEYLITNNKINTINKIVIDHKLSYGGASDCIAATLILSLIKRNNLVAR